jgi:hypothetical protein
MEALLTFLAVYLPVTFIAIVWVTLAKLTERFPMAGIAMTVGVATLPLIATIALMGFGLSELDQKVQDLDAKLEHEAAEHKRFQGIAQLLSDELWQCAEDAYGIPAPTTKRMN